MKIPSNKQWSQDNSGDTFGALGDSTNMALDTAGKARLARKPVMVYGSGNDADFGYLLAINYFSDSYIVLTADEIFEGSAPTFAFTEISGSPNVGLVSDAVIFNSLYTVTDNTKIHTWDGSSWTDRSGSLITGINHPMDVFGTSLAVGDGNTVKLFSTSYVLTQTLTLPTEYRVTTIRAVNDFIYIGTKNINGGNAKIFIWNGNSADYDYEVEVGAPWVFSMTPYLATVAAITSVGQLGLVNGTNFQELAGLPVYYNPHAVWQSGSGLLLNGKVFNRGMTTVGDTIYLNIDGDVDSGFIPEMKSGVWVYDPAVGLYHRASATSDILVSDTSLALTDSVITTSAAHKLTTGDAVIFDTVSGISGVDAGTEYYVHVESTTSFKLAASRKGLQAGNFVTVTGTPVSGDKLIYCHNSDYGAYSTNDMSSGAIAQTITSDTPYQNLFSEIIWGNRFDTVSGTVTYGLFTFSNTYNIGQITTQNKYSDNITQNWQNVYNFIDGITVDTEKVLVKLQTKFEEPSDRMDGVWASSTVINNSDTKDFALWSDIEVGNEIVIVDGLGRGYSASVTAINSSAATISITVDEAIGVAEQSVTFYRTTFQKVGKSMTVTDKNKEILKSAVADQVKSSPWCRIKVEMRGFSPALNVLDLENSVSAQG